MLKMDTKRGHERDQPECSVFDPGHLLQNHVADLVWIVHADVTGHVIRVTYGQRDVTGSHWCRVGWGALPTGWIDPVGPVDSDEDGICSVMLWVGWAQAHDDGSTSL